MIFNFLDSKNEYTGESKYQTVMRKRVIARDKEMAMRGTLYN